MDMGMNFPFRKTSARSRTIQIPMCITGFSPRNECIPKCFVIFFGDVSRNTDEVFSIGFIHALTFTVERGELLEVAAVHAGNYSVLSIAELFGILHLWRTSH